MSMTPTHYEPGASAAEASRPSGGSTSRPTRAEDERRLSVPFPPDVRVIHIPHSFSLHYLSTKREERRRQRKSNSALSENY